VKPIDSLCTFELGAGIARADSHPHEHTGKQDGPAIGSGLTQPRQEQAGPAGFSQFPAPLRELIVIPRGVASFGAGGVPLSHPRVFSPRSAASAPREPGAGSGEASAAAGTLGAGC